MILGIGIDTVEISRFADWHTLPRKQLQRLFRDQEIDYCLSVPQKTTERFAVRFAAREAFFKAFCSAYPRVMVPLLTVCRFVEVIRSDRGTPSLSVNWNQLPNQRDSHPRTHLSLTHAKNIATAFVTLEEIV